MLIAKAFGCTPWNVNDLTDLTQTQMTTSLALNELLATYRQGYPQALVPSNHFMTLLNGIPSLEKINAYRVGVNQPTIQNMAQANPLTYCKLTAQITFNRIQNNAAVLKNSPGAMGFPTLYDFLLNRFTTTIGPAANGGLDCTNIGVANPFVNGQVFNPTNTTGSNLLLIVLGSVLGTIVFIALAGFLFMYTRKSKNRISSGNDGNFLSLLLKTIKNSFILIKSIKFFQWSVSIQNYILILKSFGIYIEKI